MEKKNSSTLRLLIVMAVIDIAVIILGTFFFLHIKDTNEKASVSENNIEINKKKIENFSSVEKMLSDIKKDVVTIDSFFVEKDGAVGLIEKIESLAKDFSVNLVVDNVSINSDKIKKDSIESFNLKLSAIGLFDNLVKFEGALENLSYKTEINNFSLVGTESDNGKKGKKTVSWKATFDLDVLKKK